MEEHTDWARESRGRSINWRGGREVLRFDARSVRVVVLREVAGEYMMDYTKKELDFKQKEGNTKV